MIAHIVDQMLASVVDQVYVVLGGGDGERIAAELSGRTVRLVRNPEPDSEMLESVRCGLRVLPESVEAVLVVLGDQPGITARVVDVLVAAHRTSPTAIVVPSYAGQRGHPLLFPARYRGDVLTRYDDVGLRGLLWDHAEDVLEVDMFTSAAPSDMDYPEDYRRELALPWDETPD